MGLAVLHTLCCPSTDPEDNCIDANQNRCQWRNKTRTLAHQIGRMGFTLFFFLGGLKMFQSRDQSVLVVSVWLFCALNLQFHVKPSLHKAQLSKSTASTFQLRSTQPHAWDGTRTSTITSLFIYLTEMVICCQKRLRRSFENMLQQVIGHTRMGPRKTS